MAYFVLCVFGSGSPAQMPWVDAPEVAISAGVCAFLAVPRGAINGLTDDAMDIGAVREPSVAEPVSGMRPDKTVVARMGKDDFMEKPCRGARGCSRSIWRTGAEPSGIVIAAPPTRKSWLVTVGDRAKMIVHSNNVNHRIGGGK